MSSRLLTLRQHWLAAAGGLVVVAAFCLIALVGVVIVSSPPAGAQGGVQPVANIAVCSGPQAGEVIISWDPVSQATYYRIGYVNMVKDYPRAKASATGEWIEAFIYVDVNARNIPVTGGRGQYTLRRLVQGDRHAFTVLTSNNVVNTTETISGIYSWPKNPRWRFLEVADPNPDCSAATLPVRPTATPGPTATLRPTPTPTPTPRPTATPRPVAGAALDLDITECSARTLSFLADEITIRGTVRARRAVDDVVVYGSVNRSHLPLPGGFCLSILCGSDELGDMAAGQTRSFDASYIHNGGLPSNASCHIAAHYRDTHNRQNNERITERDSLRREMMPARERPK